MDGARNALSGFVYQVILDLALMLLTFTDGSDIDDPDFSLLVGLTASGTIEQERYEQDSLIRQLGFLNKPGTTLIQYKFSRSPKSNPIRTSHLLDIVRKLHAASIIARNAGEKVTGFALLSNRQLDVKATTILRRCREGQPDSRLSSEENNILKSLLKPEPTNLNFVDVLNRVEAIGKTFGLLTEEVINGLNELMGHCFRQVSFGAHSKIDKAQVLLKLVGYQTAIPLTPSNVVLGSAVRVSEFHNSCDVQNIFPREVVQKISQAVIQNPMVAITGNGGCGKTICLAEWALSNVNRNPPDNHAFTAIVSSRKIESELWFAETLIEWMGMPSFKRRESDTLEMVLERLKRANPSGRRPLAFFAIDGLDEFSEGRMKPLRDICEAFLKYQIQISRTNEIPDAVLVVTCRSVEVLKDWLPISPTGLGDAVHVITEIKVPEFSDQELIDFAEMKSPEIAREISISLDKRNTSDELSFDAAVRLVPNESKFLNCLKHPIMAERFLEHPNAISILSGDQNALFSLAKSFIDWFIEKLKRRRNYDDLSREILLSIFRSIAVETISKSESTFSKVQWEDAACKEQTIIRRNAGQLLSEALSSGLVLSDGSKWYWRHYFVQDYLVQLGNKE